MIALSIYKIRWLTCNKNMGKYGAYENHIEIKILKFHKATYLGHYMHKNEKSDVKLICSVT